MTTDGKTIDRTATAGDRSDTFHNLRLKDGGLTINGPCVIRLVGISNGGCRLEIGANNSVSVKRLDKQEISMYDNSQQAAD